MFKTAANAEEMEYNRDLSTIKAMSLIGKAQGGGSSLSYRVSPRGSTPTLADSANLSMLGVGADWYLDVPSGYKAFYFTWASAPELLTSGTGGMLSAPGIRHPFASKSGDTSMLNTCLLSRAISYTFVKLCEGLTVAVLPRMTSVLVLLPVADSYRVVNKVLESVSELLQPVSIGTVDLHEDMRYDRASSEAA